MKKRLHYYYHKFQKWLYKYCGLYPIAKIVKPESVGFKVFTFMEEVDELVQMIPAYRFINNGVISFHLPEVALWKYNNAIVSHGSDLVLLDDRTTIWPKYFMYNYAKNIPCDKQLICEINGYIYYKKPKQIIEVETAFSMIGVFSHIWAHAIVEYFPKLATLKYAIADSGGRRITVLIPEYQDSQLREVMMSRLQQFDVDILVVHKGESIRAKNLYYMERPTKFTDHEFEITPGDQLIPKAVVDDLKENFVRPLIEGVQTDNKYRKLFLARRGGLGKGIINGNEIESFFESQGFVFLEPHKVTLEEKAKIFQSADYIVGPFGSAFTNLVLCKPGTRVLMFSNYQRLFEHYFSMPLQYFGIKELFVTGMDDKSSNNMSHCSFYLSLDKVKEAAKEFGIIE